MNISLWRRHRPDIFADSRRGAAALAPSLGLISLGRSLAALMAVALAVGCGESREVETIAPRRGEIRESFSEPARTQLSRTYDIAMPLAGRIGRIELKPGDRVAIGQTLVEFDRLPFVEQLNEARAAVAELEAELRVQDDNRLELTSLIYVNAMTEATSETLKSSRAQIEASRARSESASRDYLRKKSLFEQGTIPDSQMDEAQLAAETSLIDLRSQEFQYAALLAASVAVNLGPRYIDLYLKRKDLQRGSIVARLEQAKSRLARAEHELHLIDIRSPIEGEGVVLRRHTQGNTFLPAGEPLLDLGDFDDLEVIADALTQDALRLKPGSEVLLEPAARLEPLRGSVERIEPAGFAKLSSLGVEQQRVNVIVKFDAGPTAAGLGVGYRLQARFFTGKKENALIIPRFSILQEPSGDFYVLKAVGGVLSKQPVELGLRGDLEIEVLSGLTESDQIVAAPDATLKPGEKVSPQAKPKS